MAETDYVSVPALKSYLRIQGERDDLALADAISAASRGIEQFTGRNSFLAAAETTGSPTSRVYASTHSTRFELTHPVKDDADFAVDLDLDRDGTFSTTWTDGTEFDSWPLNHSADGWPILELRTRLGWTFPTAYSSMPIVRITGNHGWPTVPEPIVSACKILASRYFRRSYSPEGVVSGFETPLRVGAMFDPDVERMLGPYCRRPVKV